MNRPVTLAQIAKRAGVCKATVSCALRGQHNIPEATRERIRRIAGELGYLPNPLVAAHMAQLRALKKPGYRATIAFLTDAQGGKPAELELHERYLAGCKRRGDDLGYLIDVVPLAAPGRSPGRLSDILVSRGIQGVIIAPLANPGEAVELDWESFSVAALGYSLAAPAVHRACHHHMSTIQHLMAKLETFGYRRIGLAMSEFADSRVNHLWLGGYLAHMHARPKVEHVPPLITADWRAEVFLDWYRRHRPDAVVSSTALALGWLRESGCRVPRDVGFANVFWMKVSGPCAGYYQNFEIIGAAAVDMIVGQLNSNERGVPADPRVVLTEGKWMAGGTVRQVGEGPGFSKRDY